MKSLFLALGLVASISTATRLRTQGESATTKSLLEDTDISMCHGQTGWSISFEDQFNGNSLNTSNWIARNKTHGDREKELYISSAVTVNKGKLILTTKKEHVVDPKNGKLYNYSSGWVDSEGQQFQKFGRFEVRAKLPNYKAGRPGKWPVMWPAHWLMPNQATSNPRHVCWPVGGEIDIMEAFDFAPKEFHHENTTGQFETSMTYHWAKECGHDLWRTDDGTQGHFVRPGSFFSDEFHTYGVEWNSTSVKWFIDGVQQNEINAGTPKSLFIPQDPFYMILNTAVKPWGDAQLDHGFPTTHEIDRVTWCTQN